MQYRTKLFNPYTVKQLGIFQKLVVKCQRGGRWHHRMLKVLGFAKRQMIGEACIGLRGERRVFNYSIHNTQYHSLYDPLYAFGYEPETANLIRLLLHDCGHFVDVGCNWGYYPIYARSCGFDGRITAYEPQRDVFCEMEDILGQLDLRDGVVCCNQAVAGKKMRVDVSVPGGVHSGFAVVREGNDVDAVPLDDLLEDKPDLIKIDAEGYEAEVLAGADRVLREVRPYIIFESWKNKKNPKKTMQPFRYLEERDYLFFQPAFIKKTALGDVPLFYGEYWDLEPVMNMAIIPFLSEQRFMMQRQFNVFACPREKESRLLRIGEKQS